ncbi:MAG: D-alanine--D-alanine ligase, partial [Pseudomonadota bacterium]
MSAVPHAGMPPLDESGPALSRFEFWPMWRFYLPVMPYVGWLMLRHRGITLPGIVNPAFPEDGMAGESKSGILAAAERAAPEWTARTAPWINDGQVEAAAAAIDEAALGWPVVAKPDLGCRGAGVRRLHDHADLADYIADFPAGETIIFQQYIAHEGEAGIFYIRRPNAKTGRIPSITLKYFPWVEGDGRRTLRQLIMDDERAGEVPHLYLDRHQDRLDEVIPAGEAVRLAFAGSHSRGAIFRDGSHLATDAMCATFDEISHALGGFHFGRF